MNVAIVGSGLAGVTFAEELKKGLPKAEITLFTAEKAGYYSRPLLSHGFSRPDIETKIVLKTFDALRALGIHINANTKVTALVPETKELTTEGEISGKFMFDKIVLATGSEAAFPGNWKDHRKHFKVLNSFDDLIGLRALRAKIVSDGRIPHWAVVGGGLIGCEVASDLKKTGDRVTIYHAMDRLMERQLTEEGSKRLLDLFVSEGVEVRFQQNVSGFTSEGEKAIVTTHPCGQGQSVSFDRTLPQTPTAPHDPLPNNSREAYDGVLVATGFRPRVELARDAGLKTDRGIVTDSFLRTSSDGIFAVGDVAQVEGKTLYAFVLPIRSQALWLAKFIAGATSDPWTPPPYKLAVKVHGFKP